MESQSNIEQEIAQLERQIAEKRASLGESSSDLGKETPTQESLPDDKEILHGIISEKIKEHASQFQPAPAPAPAVPPPATPPAQADDSAASYSDPRLKDKVQNLVDTVFLKGLDAGIKEASRANDPALMDALHDVLVDELYNTLLERKKLEEVK